MDFRKLQAPLKSSKSNRELSGGQSSITFFVAADTHPSCNPAIQARVLNLTFEYLPVNIEVVGKQLKNPLPFSAFLLPLLTSGSEVAVGENSNNKTSQLKMW
jgi:hypothetical protein